MSDESAVAIVGMACRLPGANTPAQFWRNLRDGRESISRFSLDELVAAGVDADLARRSEYIPARGVIERAECFDRAFFGYSPAEAAGMDPQHRVFLECSSAALDDAGIDPGRFEGLIGVFAGSNMVNPDLPSPDADEVARMLGYEKDFLATRIAYKLGLRGPAITVQTACSTALVAVHQAAQSLLGYECDAAVAGGVSLWWPQTIGHLYEEGSIMSADGRCRPFDADATGTVGGNGAGVVVLRRLPDALADGDPVVAVIRGSAVNNDGGQKIGFVAPSVTGQRDVIQHALARAETDPADISYVEAHGTATRVGDPVEVRALTQAFRASTERVGYCWLGAVKSNIGHTGPAAGVAGLIKTALMLRHRELVPTLHYRRPNPGLELDTSPFRVSTGLLGWQEEGPLVAGVSSFGMGGTNAHVVVEAPPTRRRAGNGSAPRVLCLSAATPAALRTMRTELADELEGVAADETPGLDDIAWTLTAGRRRFRHRAAVVASDRRDAAAALREDGPAASAVTGAPVAFLFPGQGSLRTGFGEAAHQLLPEFRRTFDELRTVARTRYGIDLMAVLGGDTDSDWLLDTLNQQLGLFAIGYSLARQFEAFGIRPAAMLGNSVGEYVAAAVAGLWRPADALALLYQRGQLLQSAPPGRMAVVAGHSSTLGELLAARRELTLAVEAPHYSVLAGPPEAVERLSAEGIAARLLPTNRAFHSPLVSDAAQALGAAVAETPASVPTLPVLSNLTGQFADPGRMTDARYWIDHLNSPVRLSACIETLLGSGCQAFVELGPGRAMTRMLRGHSDWRSEMVTVTIAGTGGACEARSVLSALGQLWELGFETDVTSASTRRQRCSLPPHPFEPTNCDTTPVPRAPGRPGPDPVVEAVSPDTGQQAGPMPAALARVWCEVLGVRAASPEDDFHELGGESVMAISLIGRVRDQLGLVVPIAQFFQKPTFRQLLTLAERAGPGPAQAERELSANLLILRDTGSLPPLFLAAPAAGSSLVYRKLANVLGPEQPCYGLDSPGLHDGGKPLRRFEDIARHHVEVIRRIRPDGPYVLGGWSVGGMVAHEMARQLIDLGAEVPLLACIDACVIDTKGRPLATNLGILTGAARLMATTQRRRAHRGDAEATGGEAMRDISHLPHEFKFLEVYNASVTAMLRYRPRPVESSIVVFETSPRGGDTERLRRQVAPLYRGTTKVIAAPGDHWSILGEHVGTLADDLRPALTNDPVARK